MNIYGTFEQLDSICNDKKIYLYGASTACNDFLRLCDNRYHFDGVIDGNSQKIGTQFNDYVIQSNDVLDSEDRDSLIVIITSCFVKEISEVLLKKGIKYIFSSIILECYNKYGAKLFEPFDSMSVIDEKKVSRVRNLFCDEISINVFDKLIDYRKSGIYNEWYEVFSNNQYFCEDIMKFGENEVFIDGGAFDGDTVEAFINRVNGKYCRIYSFEPDKHNYIKLSEKKYKDFYPINKGLGAKEGWVSFCETHDESSKICADNNNKVEICSIDSLEDREISFIKLDIEGAEMDALIGARNTIKQIKPKLAICLYHKPEDILEIPLFIHSLRDDYRFALRHHSMMRTETVLYCW